MQPAHVAVDQVVSRRFMLYETNAWTLAPGPNVLTRKSGSQAWVRASVRCLSTGHFELLREVACLLRGTLRLSHAVLAGQVEWEAIEDRKKWTRDSTLVSDCCFPQNS